MNREKIVIIIDNDQEKKGKHFGLPLLFIRRQLHMELMWNGKIPMRIESTITFTISFREFQSSIFQISIDH